MRVQLDKNAKIELLKAIQNGFLDVENIPALYERLNGSNAFLELMKSFSDDTEEEKVFDK